MVTGASCLIGEQRGFSAAAFVLLAQWPERECNTQSFITGAQGLSVRQDAGGVCASMYSCVFCICGEMQDWIYVRVPAHGSVRISVCPHVCVSSLRSATWAHILTVTYLLQRRGSNPRYRAPHRVIAFFFIPPHHVSSLFLTAHMQEVTSICESVSACIWINKSVCLTVSMCHCIDMRSGISLCLEGYSNTLRIPLLFC